MTRRWLLIDFHAFFHTFCYIFYSIHWLIALFLLNFGIASRDFTFQKIKLALFSDADMIDVTLMTILKHISTAWLWQEKHGISGVFPVSTIFKLLRLLNYDKTRQEILCVYNHTNLLLFGICVWLSV